jgi:beta-lactamase regulating signal transducer with metallopeptidase domain
MNAPLWFSNLVFWSAQVALLALAAALLVRTLRIRQPRVLLVHWRALIIVSLLLPFLQPWRRPPTLAAISAAPTTSLLHAIPASNAVPTFSPWHFPDLLLVAQIFGAVLLAGIFVRLAIFALGLVKLRQLRRASSPIPAQAECAALLERIAIIVGAQAEFRLSAHVDSPVTFGLSAPLILLPERFPQLDPQFQSAIACHELLHGRRRDWAHHLGEEILRVAFWFHPAIL